MTYLIQAIILLALLLIYFKIADHFNIIDKPNERSSHSAITTRGGGIIFPLACVVWIFFEGIQYPYFLIGLVMIAAISFIDDVVTLPNKSSSVRPSQVSH